MYFIIRLLLVNNLIFIMVHCISSADRMDLVVWKTNKNVDTVFHSSKSIVGQLHYFCNVHRTVFVARSNSPYFLNMQKCK